jgi:phosphoesterase RecJ-like protein
MKSLTLGALRLKAIMLANMQLYHNAQIAYFEVRIKDLLSSGAIAQDCEYALEESMYLQSVSVAILLKENRDLSIKVSLRSDGKVDVAKIANEFDGGGHSSRAGFITQNTMKIDELKNKIIDKINKEI